jgi:hypothetical protein
LETILSLNNFQTTPEGVVIYNVFSVKPIP